MSIDRIALAELGDLVPRLSQDAIVREFRHADAAARGAGVQPLPDKPYLETGAAARMVLFLHAGTGRHLDDVRTHVYAGLEYIPAPASSIVALSRARFVQSAVFWHETHDPEKRQTINRLDIPGEFHAKQRIVVEPPARLLVQLGHLLGGLASSELLQAAGLRRREVLAAGLRVPGAGPHLDPENERLSQRVQRAGTRKIFRWLKG